MKMRQIFNALIVLFIVISISTFARRVHCQSSQNRLSDDVVPKVYDLFIHVDIDNRVFSGHVAVDVHVNRAVPSIQMHNIGLDINGKVLVDAATNSSLSAESTAIQYDNTTEIMNIVLNRTLVADSDYRITIMFSGRIENDMKGLYMSTYYDGDVR